MNISQALRRIAFLKGEYARISPRLSQSMVHLVDRPPAWAFQEVQDDVDKIRQELRTLRTKLAVRNATTEIELDGSKRTLVSLIQELRDIKSHLDLITSLESRCLPQAEDIDREWDRHAEEYVSRPKICHFTTREADEASSALRERFAKVNAALEAANQTTAL